MAKILGLDLGTNSVGWAIRDTELFEESQIKDYGVVIFKKGVGEGKSGEFSLAAERRGARSKRRLYNAKRYRKWATLIVLRENNMCPISKVELDLWRLGEWTELDGKKRNKGRKYPTSPNFRQWLKMDFDGDGKVDFENPYLLRCSLLEKYSADDKLQLHKIGRALYHLVQRRGFKSSRKSGNSSYGENEYFKQKRVQHPEWETAQIWQDGLTKENRRIRASGVIQRKEYEKEFYSICNKQNLDNELTDSLFKAMYHVRPLRTQRGLVGKCTLEKNKTRIPISHPLYEEFRALQFINNIKWRVADSKNRFEPIPVAVKGKIFEGLFFRKSKANFKFEEIATRYSEKGKYEFNYNDKTSISACPVIAGLMNVFEGEWKNKFVKSDDEFGVNWEELLVKYDTTQHSKPKHVVLKGEDLWHLLFDYLQTKDKEEELKRFVSDKFRWDDDKGTQFANIDVQQGYGSLSKNAINKIIPHLQKGTRYSEAVVFANLEKVLGKDIFCGRKEEAFNAIRKSIESASDIKEKLNIVNGLVQQFFGENRRFQGADYLLTDYDKSDIQFKLENYFGESNWIELPIEEQNKYMNFVSEKYLKFIQGTQENSEKASYKPGYTPKNDYYKLPRLDDVIKQALKEKFKTSDEKLKQLYHHSDIDVYPEAKEIEIESNGEVIVVKQLGDPQPPTKAWKNPMALRTMHELKKLVNYLLEIGKIDEETKIVVEMARELNDSNKRWAIETYQKRREDQNKEFAKAILEVAKEKYPNLNENNADNIDKIRLWWEQLENGEEIYKDIKALKEDVRKYDLWKEQGCQCMYTGNTINITDLFDGTKTQFEHTLPLSISFDNSLANLTVCDANYNMSIKKNSLPTQCKNYNEVWNGFTPILSRIEKWKQKVESLKDRIEENKRKTKGIEDITAKNNSIRNRHLLQFELDYWDRKVKTFTVKEVPNWWRNSQLVDTQIISKYARAYMKSLFKRVDVQKGTTTAEFRKIFQIAGDEKKDRSKHSHHAMDAAVLTLIPGSAMRDKILADYYKAKERGEDYHTKPYEHFHFNHVKTIEDKVLINHISKDQTLSITEKIARKRGKVEYLRDRKTGKYILDKQGKRIPKQLKGDAIRGSLHMETYFGAIKVPERDENGYAKKDKQGNYLIEKDKNNKDLIWVVVRKAIGDLKTEVRDEKIILKDELIDPILKAHIETQLNKGVDLLNVKFFSGDIIRHVRCRVKAGKGNLSFDKAIPIKQHIFQSKHLHKQNYYAQNDENYLLLVYEGTDKKKKRIRDYRIINLFELSQLNISKLDDLIKEPYYKSTNIQKGNDNYELELIASYKAGTKVIVWVNSKDELKELSNDEIRKRMYRIFKFNEPAPATAYIYLQHHLEARPNEELGKEDKNFNPEIYQPRLAFTVDKLNCAIEGIDFNIKPDGEIVYNFR